MNAVFKDVKFKCQRCGTCCHHKRPPKFSSLIPLEQLPEFCEKSNLIYLTETDISRIARRTGKMPADFIDTLYDYDGNLVKVVDDGRKVILDLPVMKSKEDTTCTFYHESCSVYQERPRACRLFPFRVEEATTPDGDITLNISYNPSCPGIGKGKSINKKELEKLVVDQFLERAQSISPQIQGLAAEGSISKDAKVYRTYPGKKSKI